MDYKNIYPLKFHPVLEKPVWSGTSLSKFRHINSDNDFGISWEVSEHPNATNIIANGFYKGLTLNEVLKNNPVEILGNKVTKKEVLRVSYISAGDNLSVQVHPYKNELEQNEIWYILEAPENAEVILGVDTNDQNLFINCIKEGNIEKILKTVPVKVGDFVYIPGGLIHALTSGITVLEIGQNNDNTYRLYDYNRAREIHVNEAIKHTKLNMQPKFSKKDSNAEEKTNSSIVYSGKDFTVEMIQRLDTYKCISNPNRYFVYTNIGEKCYLSSKSGVINFKRGESILIPARLGKYCINGEEIKLIKSYI